MKKILLLSLLSLAGIARAGETIAFTLAELETASVTQYGNIQKMGTIDSAVRVVEIDTLCSNEFEISIGKIISSQE